MLLGSRYYDPALGRFLSMDPSGDGDNWYAYCDNSPTGATDPEGLAPMPNQAALSGDDSWVDALGFSSFTAFNNDFFLDHDIRLSSWTDTKTYVGKTMTADTGWQLDWSIPLGSFMDDNVTLGLSGAAGSAWGAVDSGHGSRGKAIALTAGAVGLGAYFALSEGRSEEVTAETHSLVELWHEGSEVSSMVNALKHFGKHGDELNADSFIQYLRKASEWSKIAKKGVRGVPAEGYTDDVIRYIKSGRYMDFAPDGRIISFGLR